ncbi:MAG TPA: hypothetical protein VMX17_05760 [Candidatus Glassbacteria bacterium]|nr:hypothetical protein [Candidatus Glassbacteria bacterium]
MKTVFICRECSKLMCEKGFEMEELTSSWNVMNEKCPLCGKIGECWVELNALLHNLGKILRA